MKTIIHGQIVGMKKLNNSVNGNPKYIIRIYKVDETIDLRTATDAGFAYAIDKSWQYKWANFTVSGIERQTITNIEIDA